MANRWTVFIIISLLFYVGVAQANVQASKRIEQFSNHKVHVWKTILYPSAQQKLPMHRHEHDRVLVALTDGTLKITNDQGKVHYLNFKKHKAYYLTKDVPNELHTDENTTNHTIKVMMIELR